MLTELESSIRPKDSTKPTKAYIQATEGKYKEDKITCLFNPNAYTFSKTNSWTPKESRGTNIEEWEFNGGKSMKLTMQLFFDTYATGEDVTKYTDGIWKLMAIDTTLTEHKKSGFKGRPPIVEFRWGKTWSFKAFIETITQKFLLFRYDGKPVRATLDVTFVQIIEEGKYPGQNPTTKGQPGYKQHVVKEGETIDWIAHEEYGNSTLWRHIAETNNLDDPLGLKPGQVLAISPAP